MRNDDLLTLAGSPEPEESGWPEPAAEQLDAPPEIVVESAGLRLSEFFAPRLWLAALIPLAFTATLSSLSAVRVGEGVRLHGGAIYEDVLFTAPGVPLAGWHLLPFGIPMQTELGLGQAYTLLLQTSLLLGLLALFVGLLLAAAVTKRSDDAVYACGPYAVYSLLAAAWVYRSGPYYRELDGAWPLLLGALLAPLLAGTLAKLLAAALRNASLLEVDLVPTRPIVARPATARELEPADEHPDAAAGWKHVTHAVCCPFCGNTRLQHDNPRLCTSCHRNLGILLEVEGHPCCDSCDGILVNGAAFCHHCGTWLKGEEQPEGLEVA